MSKKQIWMLSIAFLLGYLFAWGTILIDRQMLIQEQEALRQELDRVRVELKLQEMVEDFGDDWQEIVIWNEKAIESPKEVLSGQVDK